MNSSVHLCVQSEESTAQWIIKSVSHSKHQWEIPKPQQWPSQSKKEHLVLIIGYHLLPFHICWWCFINLVITSLSPQTPPFRMRYSLYTHSKLTISSLHHCLLRYYLHSPARERRWREREREYDAIKISIFKACFPGLPSQVTPEKRTIYNRFLAYTFHRFSCLLVWFPSNKWC